MNAWACCMVLFCGQALSIDDKTLLDSVWAVLQANTNYARQHRGYLAFLDTHADIASAEETYSGLPRLRAFRAESEAFDEAVLMRKDVRDAWDRYNEALVRNDALRAAEDSWYRAVLNVEAVRTGGCTAVFWLQANVADALRFIENPARLIPLPESLYPLRTYFTTHPRVRDEWRDTLRALDERAAAHDTVFAWWKACPPEYRELVECLARRPSEFWSWRRHALAWAAEPRARDWARYWRGCVRRNPVLTDRYTGYVLFLREHPAWQRAADQAWATKLGATPAWPPDGEPPGLAPREPVKKDAAVPASRKELMPKPPKWGGKPAVPLPDMPLMPVVGTSKP